MPSFLDGIEVHPDYVKAVTLRMAEMKGSVALCKLEGLMDGNEVILFDRVKVENHDYQFEGTVLSIWRKRNGGIRVVVEDDRGVCLIQSPKNLVPARPEAKP